jgi:hypothetical protein
LESGILITLLFYSPVKCVCCPLIDAFAAYFGRSRYGRVNFWWDTQHEIAGVGLLGWTI